MSGAEIKHKTSGAVLSGGPTVRAAVEWAVAHKVDLSNADLTGADLSGAQLAGGRFKNAELREALFNGADLRGACFDGASLGGASFYCTQQLTGARFHCADLQNADFTGACLSGVSLALATLTDAKLRRARLTGAKLNHADLEHADLEEADLAGADFHLACVDKANFRGVKGGDAVTWTAHFETIRNDLWVVLSTAPAEAAGLLEAVRAGRIDGSCYEGECCCLVGTIARVAGCSYRDLPGLKPQSGRSAERFFLAIQPGDTPASNPFAALVERWIEEWLTRMQAAFGPPRGA